MFGYRPSKAIRGPEIYSSSQVALDRLFSVFVFFTTEQAVIDIIKKEKNKIAVNFIRIYLFFSGYEAIISICIAFCKLYAYDGFINTKDFKSD